MPTAKTVNPEEKQVMLGFSRVLQALPRYPQIILNMLQKQGELGGAGHGGASRPGAPAAASG